MRYNLSVSCQSIYHVTFFIHHFDTTVFDCRMPLRSLLKLPLLVHQIRNRQETFGEDFVKTFWSIEIRNVCLNQRTAPRPQYLTSFFKVSGMVLATILIFLIDFFYCHDIVSTYSSSFLFIYSYVCSLNAFMLFISHPLLPISRLQTRLAHARLEETLDTSRMSEQSSSGHIKKKRPEV